MFALGIQTLVLTVILFLGERLRRIILDERRKNLEILMRQKEQLLARTRDIGIKIQYLEEQEAVISKVFGISKKIVSSHSPGDVLRIVRSELRSIEGLKFYFKKASACSEDTPNSRTYRLYSESSKQLSLRFENISGELQTVMGIFVQQLNVCLEISSLYRYYQKLSISDSLTGAANKRYFLEKYESEFSRAQRRSLPLSLIMMDIDDFKRYNDQHGHLFGDMVLKAIAESIKKTIRGVDTLARYGGEEFCVILPETGLKSAISAAERIRQKILQLRISIFDESLSGVTVSLGVASLPGNVRSAPELLEAADRCLYEAKFKGKDQVCWKAQTTLKPG